MSKVNDHKENILFICTHNSARSQMAEGIINSLFSDKYEAYSAGTQPTKINPYTIRVLLEIGIDISKHRAKDISEFKNKNFRYVVTVCDRARETCPFFPNGEIFLHSSFLDPSEAKGTDQERLSVFRSVRDSIREWIQSNFG
ncbi:MAG: arsenate reductase ArsC [Candidatus Hodarchaeota archaeon]